MSMELTKSEAETEIYKALREVDERFELINKLALEHNINVYATGPGGYGSGADLLLEDDPYNGLIRGDWKSSSVDC